MNFVHIFGETDAIAVNKTNKLINSSQIPFAYQNSTTAAYAFNLHF